MKYAGGVALERIGISRSSSWLIVAISGDGATWAGCCAGGVGAGGRTGLLAAHAFKESKDASSARTNVFTELLHSAERGRKIKITSVCPGPADLKAHVSVGF